jgi:tetratricopeptide (TPR) repeat protein
VISERWHQEWDWQVPPIKPAEATGQREFEIDFFEQVARKQPDYWEVLAVLGNHYTSVKRYHEGLAVDERLALLRPNDSVIYYNLACSYSLVGRVNLALQSLERALSLGYRDFQHMMRDRDLEPIRKDTRFRSLLSKYVKV